MCASGVSETVRYLRFQKSIRRNQNVVGVLDRSILPLSLITPGGGHRNLSKPKASRCPNSPGAWSVPPPLTHTPLRLCSHGPLCQQFSSRIISLCLNHHILPSRFISSTPPQMPCGRARPASRLRLPTLRHDGGQLGLCLGKAGLTVTPGGRGHMDGWEVTGGLCNRHNLGPFLGVLHVCAPVCVCMCGCPHSPVPSLPQPWSLWKASLWSSSELNTWERKPEQG